LAAWFHNCDKTNTPAEFKLRPEQRVLFAQTVGFLVDCVAKGTQVRTDGWKGYNGVQAAGFSHRASPFHGELNGAQVFPARSPGCVAAQALAAGHTSRAGPEAPSSSLP
jgi:hypothetical protein